MATVLRVLSALLVLSFVAPSAAACPSPAEQAAIRAALVKLWKVPASKVDYFHVVGPADPAAPCIAVLSVREHGDCHACGATLHVVELARVRGKWTRRFVQKRALELGSFGSAPRPTYVAGGAGPLLRFDEGDMHQGYATSALRLVAKVGGRYREVLFALIGEDNSGAGVEPHLAWTAEPRFIPGRAQFPDLELVVSGTELAEGKATPVNRTETWTFADTAYVKVVK